MQKNSQRSGAVANMTVDEVQDATTQSIKGKTYTFIKVKGPPKSMAQQPLSWMKK